MPNPKGNPAPAGNQYAKKANPRQQLQVRVEKEIMDYVLAVKEKYGLKTKTEAVELIINEHKAANSGGEQ